MSNSMVPYFTKMAQNNSWANETLFAACAPLGLDVIWADRPGFFGSIGRTLNHNYEVDLFYLDALEQGGAGRSVYERDDTRDVEVLRSAKSKTDARFVTFCEGLSDDDLAKTRKAIRADAVTQERVDWLILHLVQHQVHHRGQVHAMLSHAGVAPPQLDDFYLEHGRVGTAKPFWG